VTNDENLTAKLAGVVFGKKHDSLLSPFTVALLGIKWTRLMTPLNFAKPFYVNGDNLELFLNSPFHFLVLYKGRT